METDKELYEGFLKGNTNNFDKLVLRYKNNLIYFISRYIKDVHIAEDLSQDVFVYVLLHKEQYNFNYSFKTYLYMIAKSRAINYLKKESKIVNFEQIENVCIRDKELEDIIFSKEDVHSLKEALHKLKPDYQVVIYLLDIEEYSYKDVSQIMQKTVFQIKTLAFNARKKLKEIYRKEMSLNEG